MLKIIYFFTIVMNPSCNKNDKRIQINSPSENIKVVVENNQEITYLVEFNKQIVIRKSLLGMLFKDGNTLFKDPVITNITEENINDIWELPWGEVKKIQNNYREKTITISDSESGMIAELIFRAYNDGIAFRYNVKSNGSENDKIIISDELTQFNLTNNAQLWWTPAYGDNRYEELYQKSAMSEMDTSHTPLTIKYPDGIHLSIHEADLVDYSSMQLFYSNDNNLNCDLAEWNNGDKVRVSLPFQTPWRTIKIANSAKELITSYLTLNCNQPSKIKDVSWIKPSKYIGIWWGMIIGKWTWGEGPKHGATTKRGLEYVDFASEHGFDEVLIEGWQAGFKGLFPEDSVTVSFTNRTPDFDLEKVQRYAQNKNISLQAYHETSSGTKNYLSQIDSAFSLLNRIGIKNVKIGQVGARLDQKEYHYGQYGVSYYRKVLEKALEYKIGVNFHEPIKDTGERRTFPNMLTREGARGMEYNAWSGGNPPNHTTILPFTRLLNAPMDFTPGIFDLLFENIDAYVKIEFPVTFTVVDSGNGYNDLIFISEESIWQKKIMNVDTLLLKEENIRVWEITQSCQPGEWEWGVIADHTALKSYDIWLPQLLGDGSNLKFKVEPSGKITGKTTMIIPKNKLDLNDVYFSKTKKELNKQRVSSTLAKQLALYVVIYSPLQMASDFIENYKEIPAFNFIKDVPVDWDSTVVLNGEVGEYVTIARKEKNSEDWYIGSITNEQNRSLELNLSFLNKGTYRATIYLDKESSDWEKNPLEYSIENKIFTQSDTHLIKLANGGGQAIKLEFIAQ
mgnify:FL=1